MTQRLRSALGSLGLLLASLLLGLGVLELLARHTRLLPMPEPASRRMVDARWTTLLDCYPSNPRGYFPIDLREPEAGARYRRLAPLRFDEIARRHPWAVESRYNALRFRDAEPDARRPDVVRVLVFGDSFPEGQGVREDETLARALGRLLDAERPGRFEARNTSRRGLDFPELAQAFDAALAAYAPDLVLYTLTLNDAAQPEAFRARQGFVNDWILDRQRLPDAGPPASRLRIVDFVRGRVEAWRVGRATTRHYLDLWSDANPGWRETQELLAGMKRRAEAQGARLVVAPWPLLVGLEAGYPFEPAHAEIGRFCLAAGIAHHELLPALRGRRTAELWVHAVDHHPNEIAHRIAAESLAPLVLKLAAP